MANDLNAEVKTIVIGLLEKGSGCGLVMEMPRRVYSPLGIAPTIRTFGGGGLEPKVIVYDKQREIRER